MAIITKYPAPCGIIRDCLCSIRQNSDSLFPEGKLDWKLMTSTGGMPSSHSAAVTSLTTAIAYEEGLDSPMFAVSAIFAVIVMFDATGIRYQAGQQALIINQMRVDFQTFVQEAKGWQQKDGQQKIQELKTLLGHKPSEVFAVL